MTEALDISRRTALSLSAAVGLWLATARSVMAQDASSPALERFIEILVSKAGIEAYGGTLSTGSVADIETALAQMNLPGLTPEDLHKIAEHWFILTKTFGALAQDPQFSSSNSIAILNDIYDVFVPEHDITPLC